jgi:hypothetical protein
MVNRKCPNKSFNRKRAVRKGCIASFNLGGKFAGWEGGIASVKYPERQLAPAQVSPLSLLDSSSSRIDFVHPNTSLVKLERGAH